MDDTNVTIFIESSITKTFLFECSKLWAAEGFCVHYVSMNLLTELPPLIENNQLEKKIYEDFMQITFLTIPSCKDFIEYMVNLRKSTNIPRALIVDDINSFATNSTLSEFVLMCSMLKSTTAYCSLFHDRQSFLVISTAFDDLLNNINVILTPKTIWRPSEINEGGNKKYIVTEIPLCAIHTELRELHFQNIEDKEGGIIRITNLKTLFEESCKFNNVVT